MAKQTHIVVKFAVEGLHYWKDALAVQPEVAFLAHPHRHMFHFEVIKPVTHDDRDIEIIMFKRELMSYLIENYDYAPCQFRGKSCEMLAEEIAVKFGCSSVQVLEDGENGAIFTQTI